MMAMGLKGSTCPACDGHGVIWSDSGAVFCSCSVAHPWRARLIDATIPCRHGGEWGDVCTGGIVDALNRALPTDGPKLYEYLPKGAEQQRVEALASAWAREWRHGQDICALVLVGPPGRGKSRIAAAVLRTMVLLHGLTGYWANTAEMLEQGRRNDYDAMDRSREAGVIVLDDACAERSSDWVREQMYCVINDRYDRCAPTIVTSNVPLKAWDKVDGQGQPMYLGSRVQSRFMEMGMVLELLGQDLRAERARA